MTKNTDAQKSDMTGKNIPATSIKDAADRLQQALSNLETSLEPMVARLGDLEQKQLNASEGETDRARLASELDELTAEHTALRSRETQFSKLADETTQELDAVITQVLHALGEG